LTRLEISPSLGGENKEMKMSKPIPASVEANRAKFREEGAANKAARAQKHAELIASQKALGAANREARAQKNIDNIEQQRALKKVG